MKEDFFFLSANATLKMSQNVVEKGFQDTITGTL